MNKVLQDEYADLGANGVQALTPNYWYQYIAVFTSIAAGVSATASLKTNTQWAFFCDQVIPCFQCNGAFGAAIDGTPLSQGGNPLIANNTMPTLAHLRLSVTQTDRPWQNLGANDGVRLDSFGPDERSTILYKVAIAPNDTLVCTVFNDGPATVKGQLIFRGHNVSVAG